MIGLKNGTPCHDNGTFVVAPNHGILKTLFNFELSFWRWKSMPEPNVAQNNAAEFSFFRVIVVSCSIISRKQTFVNLFFIKS